MKEIPGMPGYFCTKDGDVYSNVHGKGLFKMKPHVTPRGYLRVTIYINKKPNSKSVHSLVLETFTGPRPSKTHHGAHLNGNSHDNRHSNLVWATPAENMAHSMALGANAKGERHGGSKLTYNDVRRIKAIRAAYFYSIKQAAKELNITTRQVRDILDGKFWKHVPYPKTFRAPTQPSRKGEKT